MSMADNRKYRIAMFIGKDGSCGLKNGRTYCIEIWERKSYGWPNYRVYVNGIGIPYDTMNAIKKNWKI